MKYTKALLEEAVVNSHSVMGVLRYLGLKQTGGTHTHISKKIKDYGLDTSHFQIRNVTPPPPRDKKRCEEILVVLPAGSYRTRRLQLLRAMLESGVEYTCSSCGMLPEWNGKVLTLEIDHISGDWLDNRLENLRFLCPNCHSQQSHTNNASQV